LTPDGLKAALAQNTDAVFLECLTISHPSLSPPIRLVNDRQDLTRTAGTFVAFPFEARLHARSDDMDASAEIVADNVDQRIIEALRGLSHGATVRYEVVLAGSPNNVEQGPFDFEIKGFSANVSTVSLKISFALDFLNEAFPKDYFAPWNATT
jgi:hypothetical protein